MEARPAGAVVVMDGKAALTTLGLSAEQAGDEKVLRARYRQLSLQHHPDKNRDDPDAAAERFKRVTAAYEFVVAGGLEREAAEARQQQQQGFGFGFGGGAGFAGFHPGFGMQAEAAAGGVSMEDIAALFQMMMGGGLGGMGGMRYDVDNVGFDPNTGQFVHVGHSGGRGFCTFMPGFDPRQNHINDFMGPYAYRQTYTEECRDADRARARHAAPDEAHAWNRAREGFREDPDGAARAERELRERQARAAAERGREDPAQARRARLRAVRKAEADHRQMGGGGPAAAVAAAAAAAGPERGGCSACGPDGCGAFRLPRLAAGHELLAFCAACGCPAPAHAVGLTPKPEPPPSRAEFLRRSGLQGGFFGGGGGGGDEAEARRKEKWEADRAEVHRRRREQEAEEARERCMGAADRERREAEEARERRERVAAARAMMANKRAGAEAEAEPRFCEACGVQLDAATMFRASSCAAEAYCDVGCARVDGAVVA